MDEDISIISTESRVEKIKKYLISSRKQLIILIITLILILIGFFGYSKYLNEKRLKLSELYNAVTFNYISGQNQNIKDQLIYIINAKDSTYSPLALYFVIDWDDKDDKIKTLDDYLDNKPTNLLDLLELQRNDLYKVYSPTFGDQAQHSYLTPGIKTIKFITITYNMVSGSLGRWKLSKVRFSISFSFIF